MLEVVTERTLSFVPNHPAIVVNFKLSFLAVNTVTKVNVLEALLPARMVVPSQGFAGAGVTSFLNA